MSVGIQRLREDPETVRRGAIAKGEDAGLVDRAIALDVERREAQGKADALRATAARRIGDLTGLSTAVQIGRKEDRRDAGTTGAPATRPAAHAAMRKAISRANRAGTMRAHSGESRAMGRTAPEAPTRAATLAIISANVRRRALDALAESPPASLARNQAHERADDRTCDLAAAPERDRAAQGRANRAGLNLHAERLNSCGLSAARCR